MLRIMCCGRPCFERLLQRKSLASKYLKSCGRPCFERLLQHTKEYNKDTFSCGRPCFERLLQQPAMWNYHNVVVEDLVLKGYYNRC